MCLGYWIEPSVVRILRGDQNAYKKGDSYSIGCWAMAVQIELPALQLQAVCRHSLYLRWSKGHHLEDEVSESSRIAAQMHETLSEYDE